MKKLAQSFLFAVISISSVAQTSKALKNYQLWYDAPTPNRGADNSKIQAGGYPFDADWENWSLPIGNGWMGASIFGRNDTDRIQLTENSLDNKSLYKLGGLTNFAEIYLDFNHSNSTNFKRGLSISDAIAYTHYQHNGVNYSREYFTSYPDKVLVIKAKASAKGKLSFVVRPVIPYLKSVDTTPDNNYRTGTVSAKGNVITLSGKMGYFNIIYEGQIKVMSFGGSQTANNDEKGDNGKIEVANADSAIVLVAVGTNYKLDSKIFTEPVPSNKLNDNTSPHVMITKILETASKKSYTQLLQTHLNDYHTYFNRVNLNLGGVEAIMPTDKLLAAYKAGIHNPYLEELYFQFGRYLLISSSRPGCLPANLQGIWSQYDVSPWTSGYWHNVNVQMNYWPAFNTNLAEMFTSYSDYNQAFREEANNLATKYIAENNPSSLSPLAGGNGWTIGTGASPYIIFGPGGHSGPGTGGFTTKLFWDQYDFTRDINVLKQVDYPAVLGMGKFLSKVTKLNPDGLLLASPSASPEQKVKGQNYTTVGCAFDQEMIYENHNDLLKMAKILNDKDAVINTIEAQIGKLDPVQVGWSGQIKEYREENKYGDIGEYKHRHISHLVGLYPGTLINSNTPAWIDAAKVTLTERGDFSKGWAIAHRLNLWARAKEGDRAYSLFGNLLSTCTKDNLWDTHPPFQIDGNFGGTAGVAEMLLQSHEGYIAPLPALPAAWKKGNYKGLVARGNFEVAASWDNGQATAFEIKAKVGGECYIYYPNISKAIITDASDDKKLSFKKLNIDLISLQTSKEEVVRINNIPFIHKMTPPDTLLAKQLDDKTVELSWGALNKTDLYNIYIAKGNSPIYQMLASNQKGESYQFSADNIYKLGRCTFKITKVGKDGRESVGKLVYINNHN